MNILPILNTNPAVDRAAIIRTGSNVFPIERNGGSPIRIGDYFIDRRYTIHVAVATPYDDYVDHIVWQRGNRNDTRIVVKMLTERGQRDDALKVDTANKGPF